VHAEQAIYLQACCDAFTVDCIRSAIHWLTNQTEATANGTGVQTILKFDGVF